MIALRRTPAYLLYVDSPEHWRAWRLRTHWDGRRSLTPLPEAQPLPTGKRKTCLTLVAPQYAYWRKLARYPGSEAARRALFANVEDQFPLAPEAHHYALHSEPPTLYALPRSVLEASRQAGWQALAVWTGPVSGLAAEASATSDTSDTTAQRLLAHLSACERSPRDGEFLRRYRLLPDRLLLGAALLLSLLFAVALALLLLAPQSPLLGLQQQQSVRLRMQAGPAAQQYPALQRMLGQQNVVSAFQKRPGHDLPETIGRIIADLPAGFVIDRIIYKDQQFTLSGRGSGPANNLRAWAERHPDILGPRLHIETGGTLTIFRLQPG